MLANDAECDKHFCLYSGLYRYIGYPDWRFHGFPQSLRRISGLYLKSGNVHFLPYLYLLLIAGLRLIFFFSVPRGNVCTSSYATTVLQIHSLCWWLIMLLFRCMYCELLKAFKYAVNIQIWSFDVVRMKRTADRKRAVGSNSEWSVVAWNFVIVPFFHSSRTHGKFRFFLIFRQKWPTVIMLMDRFCSV